MEKQDQVKDNRLEKIINHIESGEKKEAKKNVTQLWEEKQFTHDGMVESIATLQTFIAEKLGEEAIKEVHRKDAESFWKPMFMEKKDDPASLAELFNFVNRAHGSDYEIEEDEEKYVFKIKQCGSGGEILKKVKEGKDDRFGATKKPYSWSFNKKGIPYYCCHCSIWFNNLPKELDVPVIEHQFGEQFDEQGNPIDEPCKTIIYKNLE